MLIRLLPTNQMEQLSSRLHLGRAGDRVNIDGRRDAQSESCPAYLPFIQQGQLTRTQNSLRCLQRTQTDALTKTGTSNKQSPAHKVHSPLAYDTALRLQRRNRSPPDASQSSSFTLCPPRRVT